MIINQLIIKETNLCWIERWKCHHNVHLLYIIRLQTPHHNLESYLTYKYHGQFKYYYYMMCKMERFQAAVMLLR